MSEDRYSKYIELNNSIYTSYPIVFGLYKHEEDGFNYEEENNPNVRLREINFDRVLHLLRPYSCRVGVIDGRRIHRVTDTKQLIVFVCELDLNNRCAVGGID